MSTNGNLNVAYGVQGAGHGANCVCATCQMYRNMQQVGSTGSMTITTLTKEEQEELSRLEAERLVETKRLRLEAFKSLHPDLRQVVVDCIMWQEHRNNISELVAVVSPRELDLKRRSFLTSVNAAGDGWRGFNNNLLPEGLTIEDLIQAHADKVIEEKIE